MTDATSTNTVFGRIGTRTIVIFAVLGLVYLFAASLTVGDMVRLDDWGFEPGGRRNPFAMFFTALFWPVYWSVRIGIAIMA